LYPLLLAVKDSLVVDFTPKQGDPRAQFDLPYDFKLVSYEAAKQGRTEGATAIAQ